MALADSFGPPLGNPFMKSLGQIDFTLLEIPGLFVYLDAFRGVIGSPGPVGQWLDRTMFGNNAVQPIPSKGPTFNSTGINGFPSLTFDGTNDQMDIADSASIDILFDFTAYAVIKPTSLANPFGIDIFNRNGFGYQLGVNAFGQLRADAVDSALNNQFITSTGTISAGVSILAEVHFQLGGAVNFRVNGVDFGTPVNTLIDRVSNNNPLIIGDNMFGTCPFFGEIGQIVIYDNLLNTLQRNNVGRFLTDLYSLPYTNIP